MLNSMGSYTSFSLHDILDKRCINLVNRVSMVIAKYDVPKRVFTRAAMSLQRPVVSYPSCNKNRSSSSISTRLTPQLAVEDCSKNECEGVVVASFLALGFDVCKLGHLLT